jgi:hypothetical protein
MAATVILVHLWPGGTFWSGWDAIWPNIAASIIVAGVLYVWKIRPHLKRTHEHRADMARYLADLRHKHDDLHALIEQVEEQVEP